MCSNSYFVRRQKIVINNNKYVVTIIRYCTERTVPETYRYFHLLTTARTGNLAEYQLPPLPCTDYLGGYLCDTYLTHRLPSWPYDRPAISHRLPSWSVARTVHPHRCNYKYVIPSCYRCYTNICRRSESLCCKDTVRNPMYGVVYSLSSLRCTQAKTARWGVTLQTYTNVEYLV